MVFPSLERRTGAVKHDRNKALKDYREVFLWIWNHQWWLFWWACWLIQGVQHGIARIYRTSIFVFYLSLSLFCGKNLYVLERWILKEINFIRNILYKHFTLHKLIHEVGIHLKESNYYKMNVVMNILIYSSVVITQSQVFHKCSHQCKKKKKKNWSYCLDLEKYLQQYSKKGAF